MRNTLKEFHLGIFTETFLDFCKKVLLPILLITGLLIWASFKSKAYAKEPPKKQVDTFYLVQEYLGEVRLHPSEPHRLSCVKDKCTLLKRDTVVNNFFVDKKCKEVKLPEKDFVVEYSCGASNLKIRVMEISGEKYFRLLLEPTEGKENTKV